MFHTFFWVFLVQKMVTKKNTKNLGLFPSTGTNETDIQALQLQIGQTFKLFNCKWGRHWGWTHGIRSCLGRHSPSVSGEHWTRFSVKCGKCSIFALLVKNNKHKTLNIVFKVYKVYELELNIISKRWQKKSIFINLFPSHYRL